MVIFDRTWYGRVLVERVEGFCTQADWLRAYSELNDFEHDIWRAGGVVIKFWLQISDEEQLKRFDERAKIEHKRFKITEEDWRNREKAAAYHEAVCDMIDRTSTGTAPWTIVEANDKLFARIKVLRTICERLERELKLEPMKPPVAASPAPKDADRHEPTSEATAEEKAAELPAAAPAADAANESAAAKEKQGRSGKQEKAREAEADAKATKAKEAVAERESKVTRAKEVAAEKGTRGTKAKEHAKSGRSREKAGRPAA